MIKAWDPLTGRNVVRVGGTDLVDLPILNSTESLIMTPGAVVGIMAVGSTWAILGRFVGLSVDFSHRQLVVIPI